MCAADPRWKPEWELSPAFVPKGRYLSREFLLFVILARYDPAASLVRPL